VAKRIAETYGAVENWNYNVVGAFWQGAQNSGGTTDPNQKIGTLATLYKLELVGLSWSSGGFTLSYLDSGHALDLNGVFADGSEYGYLFDISHFTDEFALDSWLRQGLGGGFDASLYYHLTITQKTKFKTFFRTAFSTEIMNRYTFVREQYNAQAYAMGLRYGALLGGLGFDNSEF